MNSLEIDQSPAVQYIYLQGGCWLYSTEHTTVKHQTLPPHNIVETKFISFDVVSEHRDSVKLAITLQTAESEGAFLVKDRIK